MLRHLVPFSAAALMLMLAAHVANAQYYCQECQNSQNSQNCDDCEQGGGCPLTDGKGWPDQGFNPPARLPVNRDGIWYQNSWPSAWYGNPGGQFIANAPSVYQPTDTTQLGYSYAKVPTWRSVRMIPPRPVPSAYHSRVCVPRPHFGAIIDGHNTGSQYCPPGQSYPGHVMQGQMMEWSDPQMVQAPARSAAPPAAPPEVATAQRPQSQHRVRQASHSRRPGRKSIFSLTRLAEMFD